ncbi:class I adenylate-forming enzyme family protein [Methylobacterium sp. ID0610]|uniref:class I adenylate-forming enzyme family protein n=1 Tax=Methylobacterium carpenticola TaxID=3344827 RepID=UPI00367B9D65
MSAPEPDDVPLGQRIAEAATRIPDNAALRFEGRRLSYAELDRAANRLANALAAAGVGKGDVVGLYLPNTPQMVVGLVAASKLGAVASGFSTLLSPRELRDQLIDSGATVLLALDSLVQQKLAAIPDLPPSLMSVVVTGAMDFVASAAPIVPSLNGPAIVPLSDFVAGHADVFEQVPVSGDDLFLLQYTGGTTGHPKGAMLTVRAVMTNPRMTNVYQPYVYGAERMASPFPFFHIGGVAGLAGSLAMGAEFLVVLDPRNIDKFIDHVIDMQPTRLGAIPTFYQMLMKHPRAGEIDFSVLKLAITGGAPITSADRERVDALLGAGKLADYFGMTETASAYVCNPPAASRPGALGIPVPGADVRIVDVETGRRSLPAAEAGEIITAGPHLTRGYKGRAEETAKALRPLDGKTWMYTGDVGYMDEDGYIYLCDRSKDMLIVGGFKVFSLEVEDVVRQLPVVAAAALVGTPDTERPGNDVVHLVVQPSERGRLRDECELRRSILAFCRDNLAPYKVPKTISLVASLPLTSVGKIDKKTLRTMVGRDAP